MKKLLLLLLVVITALAGYHYITTDSHKIEKDITTRLANTFGIKGFGDNIQTEVSGRDVTLSGTVADQAMKDEAESAAKSLYGVRVVNNNIVVAQGSQAQAEPAPKPMVMPELEAAPEPKIVENPFVMEQPVVVQEETVVVAQPTMDLQPVMQEETVVVTSAPVVTYEEEKPTRTVPNIQLDGPLAVTNGRVIRREVDTRIASKTVEAACEDDLRALMWNNKILFDSAKATIQSKSYPLLDKLVVAAKNCDSSTIITINGYTDNEGDAEYNRKLSLDRARAVGKYMLKRGVAKRVKVVGHGENNPVASNDTEEGKAQNRRIEFKVFTD